MNFKQFFESRKSGPHHHSVTSLTKATGSKEITSDGGLKPIKPRVAKYITKGYFKNKKLERAKRVKGSINRISPVQAQNLAIQNGINLKNLTPTGLCLNGKHGVTLYRDSKGFYLSN
jgi:hypothetical protein